MTIEIDLTEGFTYVQFARLAALGGSTHQQDVERPPNRQALIVAVDSPSSGKRSKGGDEDKQGPPIGMDEKPIFCSIKRIPGRIRIAPPIQGKTFPLRF